MPMESGDGSPATTVVPLAEVRTPEQFVAAMRQRKAASGLTYLELERRADAVGDELSPEAALVGVDGMPSERLVAAFVRACDGSPDEVADWVAAHRRISAATQESAVATPPARSGNAAWAWFTDLLPPVFVHARRPVRVLAVAVATLLLATVAGVWVTSGPLEEYGMFPAAAPEEDGEGDEEAAPTAAPQGAVRKKPKAPASKPPTPTAPTPTPGGTASDDYPPYPTPADGDRYPTSSPADEPPTEEWPGGDDGGGTYCEPYPSPVCRHG